MGIIIKLRCPKIFCKYHYIGKEIWLGPSDILDEIDAYTNTDLSKEQLDFFYNNENYYCGVCKSLFVCPKCGKYSNKDAYVFKTWSSWAMDEKMEDEVYYNYNCPKCKVRLKLVDYHKVYCPKHKKIPMNVKRVGLWD